MQYIGKKNGLIVVSWQILDKDMNLENWQTQLRKGLLDIVVLNLLHRGPSHGYEMVQTMKRIEGLQIREGNIYPVLARLETDGLVTSYSEPSTDGPPRKYFRLTESGQKALEDMNKHWDRITESIQQVRKGV
jgi:PadR family transcriptional regulator PadR